MLEIVWSIVALVRKQVGDRVDIHLETNTVFELDLLVVVERVIETELRRSV